MKFTLVGDFDESDYYGICVAILSRFKHKIPNWREVRFDSILSVNYRDRFYEVDLSNLDRYDISREEIIMAMHELGSSPIEEGLVERVLE